MKVQFRYEHNTAQLNLEGLPDKSLGQSENKIGILSSWQLKLVNLPLLEGKIEHLQSLISVILPYSRYYMSGIERHMGDSKSPINICTSNSGHKITLRSSQEGVEPLEVTIDDARFADLLRCIDDVLIDERILIKWKVPEYLPLKYSEKINKIPITIRLAAPILGVSTLLLFAGFYLSLPAPELIDKTELKEDPNLSSKLK